MRFAVKLIVVAVLILSSRFTTIPVAEAQGSFPDAPGRDTLLLVCSQCHSLNRITNASLTEDEWQLIVYDMISRGAPVHQTDIASLVKYLQNNFAVAER